MITKHFLLWLPMIAIAFANATVRELIFIKYLNELRAHQLSTLTLIILCTIYVAFIFPLLNVQSSKKAFSSGTVWVVLTVLFEFTLGLLVNRTWENLWLDYNLILGRTWLLFLLCLFMLPYIFYVIKK
jgi:hypothetical protein